MTDHRDIHLVDDDEAIRHSASFMLRHAGFNVRTYKDGLHFLQTVDRTSQGCVLLDVRMPGMDGIAVLRALDQHGISMPVIVLTGHGDVSVAVEAMKAGAKDFIEKPYEKQSLLAAINATFHNQEDRDASRTNEVNARAKIASLTKREREVLERLVEGMTNKAIAEDLSISSRTVEIHRGHVMEKLEADSLSAALRIAFNAKLGSTAD
ncbi:MAG: response regulator transcription factor [Acidobacteria bacterium]|nr:response regulator transcription factor [Acidobacteriota bacterium]